MEEEILNQAKSREKNRGFLFVSVCFCFVFEGGAVCMLAAESSRVAAL